MTIDQKKEADLFIAALELPTLEERQAYVRSACNGDEGLYQRVLLLMNSHDHSQGPLDVSPVEIKDTRAIQQPDDAVGQQIGPYKLREKIGEGGFGVVYVAEQKEPVSRKVALKVIKPGMDSKDIIARFEAERQALAMMDHPNVAKVLDAGATESGHPYFVMELVHGMAITKYCDSNKLTNRQRLELFIDVCHAVQHSHQKGIIHRDIKPSNVMVTMADHRPVVKVIDFGVAKALHQNLTDKSIYTGYGQLVGTPMYMSPEQAQMSCLDIDTRSDVYSLGVLLYELLTGTTPFDKNTFKKAGFDEVRRMIREVEPRRPSEQVSTLKAEQASTISDSRNVNHGSLGKSLRGDLDWIVMKTLEKDRSRRYESANGLAADLSRFLNGEPVTATPHSTSYRIRRFVTRNKSAVTIACVISFLLLSGLVGLIVSNNMLAEREQQVVDALGQAGTNLALAESNLKKARKVVDDYFTTVSEEKLLNVPSLKPLRKEMLELALKYYKDFLEQDVQDESMRAEMAAAYLRVGVIRFELGEPTKAVAAFENAVIVFKESLHLGSGHVELKHQLSEAHRRLAHAYFQVGQIERALTAAQAAIDVSAESVKAHPENTECRYAHMWANAEMHYLLSETGQRSRSGEYAKVAWQESQVLLQRDDLKKTQRRDSIMAQLIYADDIEDTTEALKVFDESIKHLNEHLSVNKSSPEGFSQLVYGYRSRGERLLRARMDGAEDSFAKAVEIGEKQLVRFPTSVELKRNQLSALWGLSIAKEARDRSEDGIEFVERAVDIAKQMTEFDSSPQNFRHLSNMMNRLAIKYKNSQQNELEKKVRKDRMELVGQFATEFPDQILYQTEYVDALKDWAAILGADGKLDEATATFTEALKIADEKSNDSIDMQRLAARCLIQLAQLLYENEKYPESSVHAIDGWKRYSELLHRHPESTANLDKSFSSFIFAAQTYLRQERVDDANKLANDFETKLRRVLGELPNISKYRLVWQCGANAQSWPNFVALAVEVAEPLVEVDPRRSTFFVAGLANYRAGNFQEAQSHLEKSNEMWDGKSDPNHLFVLAMAYQKLNQQKLARSTLDKAIEKIGDRNLGKFTNSLVQEATELMELN